MVLLDHQVISPQQKKHVYGGCKLKPFTKPLILIFQRKGTWVHQRDSSTWQKGVSYIPSSFVEVRPLGPERNEGIRRIGREFTSVRIPFGMITFHGANCSIYQGGSLSTPFLQFHLILWWWRKTIYISQKYSKPKRGWIIPIYRGRRNLFWPFFKKVVCDFSWWFYPIVDFGSNNHQTHPRLCIL